MQIASPGRPHLTYCTNIYRGESLTEVRAAIDEQVARVREALSPPGSFGVGLRLSARAAEELSLPGAIDGLRDLLARHSLYVFTINGFPYGAFHGERVKEAVYRPDWLERERVSYTDRLARHLALLLPSGCSGSVSTVPGAFRSRARAPGSAAVIAEHILQHTATLFRVREETGKLIELALEPEPCCLLETTADTTQFFDEHLFTHVAARRLGALTGLSDSAAAAFLRRHVGVCLDACHLAVEFEEARASVASLRDHGIRIGKIQVTAALSTRLTGQAGKDAPILEELERYADGVYLHQVVERSEAGLVRHLDLPDAIQAARLPVFAERLEPLGSTQPFLRDLLSLVSEECVTEHLEVETYTWDVLPPEHRETDVSQAIARELRWTIRQATARPKSGS